MVSEDEVNQLLAALSPEEFERIWPHLSELDIPVGHVLFNPGYHSRRLLSDYSDYLDDECDE